MSMPFRTIKCDSCDFEASSTCTWGHFEYVSEEGVVFDVKSAYGWCYSCKTIRPIEDLSDKEQLISEIDQRKNEIEAIQRTGIWGRLVQLFGNENLRLKNLSEEIESREIRLAFIENRKSPRKCLICASGEVEELFIPFPEGDELVKIEGFIHPGCGGRLVVQNNPMRLIASLPQREYDLEGRLVKQSRS